MVDDNNMLCLSSSFLPIRHSLFHASFEVKIRVTPNAYDIKLLVNRNIAHSCSCCFFRNLWCSLLAYLHMMASPVDRMAWTGRIFEVCQSWSLSVEQLGHTCSARWTYRQSMIPYWLIMGRSRTAASNILVDTTWIFPIIFQKYHHVPFRKWGYQEGYAHSG